MMLPIAMSVLAISNDDPGKQRFTLNLLLGIAYAANCGGIATLVGTPPNVAMAGILSSTFGIEVGFFDWLIIGLPFSALLLWAVYLLLTLVLHPMPSGDSAVAHDHLERERNALGTMHVEERRVLIVFSVTALLWMLKDAINAAQTLVELNDSSISMLGGLALFVVPGKKSSRLLEWSDTSALPWGILLLFGGGMALANALKSAGLIDRIATYFTDSPESGLLVITASLIVISLLLTELISNLALVLVFVPVVGAIAEGLGISPLQFAIPVTLAASCAFMLPMATPPNAIVFAGGQIKISEMVRSGALLNLVAALLAIAFSQWAIPLWIEYFY
jgi:sodium-dependent dicarboxylate transporter 2/3/5